VTHINWSRLLAGGLYAAAVVLAIEFGFHWWLRGADWWFFQALAHPLQEAKGLLLYVGRYTLVGLTAIWLYVALRPRFGPGPKTAILSGFAYWVIGYALPVWGFYYLIGSDYRAELLRLPALVALLEVTLGTLAGASVYHRPAGWSYVPLR
jgi:hypothetical protein